MLSQQESKGSFKEGKTMLENIKEMIRIHNCTIRKMLAEALGMFILMVRRNLCVCVCVCETIYDSNW